MTRRDKVALTDTITNWKHRAERIQGELKSLSKTDATRRLELSTELATLRRCASDIAPFIAR